MRCISVGLCEPRGRVLGGLLPFVARKTRPDALAIRELNFNSWPASFEVKELLREEVNLNPLFAKANKVLWTQKKWLRFRPGQENLLMSAGCRMASLLQRGLSHVGLCLLSNSSFYSNTLFQRLLGVFITLYASYSTKTNTVLLLTDLSMNAFVNDGAICDEYFHTGIQCSWEKNTAFSLPRCCFNCQTLK